MTDIFTFIFSMLIIFFAIGGLVQSRKSMKRHEAQMRASMDFIERMRTAARDNTPEEYERSDQIASTTRGSFASSTMVMYPTGSSFAEEVEVTDEAVVVEEVPEKLIVETDRYEKLELGD